MLLVTEDAFRFEGSMCVCWFVLQTAGKSVRRVCLEPSKDPVATLTREGKAARHSLQRGCHHPTPQSNRDKWEALQSPDLLPLASSSSCRIVFSCGKNPPAVI